MLLILGRTVLTVSILQASEECTFYFTESKFQARYQIYMDSKYFFAHLLMSFSSLRGASVRLGPRNLYTSPTS